MILWPSLLACMHVVTTPLFLIRLLWVHKQHCCARHRKLSCWQPPLTFTHERLMCLTSIMMTTYSVAMALCCSPTLFPPFLAQARYHCLLIGSTKPPRLRAHSRFRVPSPPPLVPTNHLATPPEFHFAPLFPSFPVEQETIECNMASTGTQRSSFSWTVPSPSFPVTIDTGATFTITPFCSDFVTGLTSTEGVILHGLAMNLEIEGFGTVHWNLPADDSSQITLAMTAYYVPEAKRRLLSPQHYLQNSSNPTKQHFCDHSHSHGVCFGASSKSYRQVPPSKQLAHNPNVECTSTEGAASRGYGGMCVERQQHEPDTSSKGTSPLAFSFVPSRFQLTSMIVANWASWKLPIYPCSCQM